MEVLSGSTEEKIINASFDILEKEGIKGATTKKIAKRANVSEVTLFRKFKNKQRLIEVVKDYYFDRLIERVDEIFSYSPEDTTEEYLKRCFEKILNLTDHELNIMKIGIEEVRDIPAEYMMFPKLTRTVTGKLSEFIRLKIDNNEIRNINPDIFALNIFSIIFESIVLWKVYGIIPQHNIDRHIDDFLDITLNGISV